MATLDNFHTGNGGAWRDHLRISENQYNQAIGLGLQSADRWDMTNRVPIPLPYLDKDKHRRMQPQAAILETRDSQVKDLYVPLTGKQTNVLQGDTMNSKHIYDTRPKMCPMRRLPFFRKDAPIDEACSIRHRPY